MQALRGVWPTAMAAAGLLGITLAAQVTPPAAGVQFHTGIDLVTVAVTVSDRHGLFVEGLGPGDFELLEDGVAQPITYFSRERVPVSLVLAVDTSGSMEGERIESARAALDRFLLDLLGPEDEVAIYRIADRPDLIASWTRDRARASRALRRIAAEGGTALFDTVAQAAHLAQRGVHRKKAIVILSDGNDTSSSRDLGETRRIVRATEVMVYAVGVDGWAEWAPPPARPRRLPPIIPPFPIPGQGRPPWFPPGTPPLPREPSRPRQHDPVDVATLRALTDESGGRTEVVRAARAIDRATASIATELSQQYSLGYASAAPRDGHWHEIEVRLPAASDYQVRHRRGFVATP